MRDDAQTMLLAEIPKIRAALEDLAQGQARLIKAVDALIENELRQSGERARARCQLTENARTCGQFRLVCEQSCVQRCAGFQCVLRRGPALHQT